MDIAELADRVRSRIGADVIATLHDEVLPRIDELTEELTALYRAQIPAYESFDPDVIRTNTRMVLEVVVQQLGDENRALTTSELADLARDLAAQGVPLGPVAQSVQLGSRRIAGVLRDRAGELTVPDAELAAMQDLAWEWATEGAAVIQAVEREVAVSGATRRADFLRRLLAGDVPPAELAPLSRRHRLDPDRDYRVACLGAPEMTGTSTTVLALRTYGASGSHPVVDAVLDDQLVALVPTLPAPGQVSGTVGISTPQPLHKAAQAHRQAHRALHTATRHGVAGISSLADLGPLVLLDSDDEAADLLDAKHLAPLRDLGPGGDDILHTATTYLAHDRRAEETAAALHLHRNTVRYRLTRFTEVTGLDLERTEHLVLAWWLTRRSAADR